ncbi:MAG: DUF4276 family protein [Planctomycetota bacterium]|nr:DUF4276 family protein [Planctomycetaceae bacterium]MDQ3330041.1 DUF4276 family protein [Planctomycetota bacterium]
MADGRLRIASIVEGHGEQSAIPRLLTRICKELLNAEFVDVLKPNRKRRDRLIGNIGAELEKAVEAAARLLAERGKDGIPSLILVIVDADDDCAAAIAAQIRRVTTATRRDVRSACVVAVKEYETWFVAAAESLHDHLVCDQNEIPLDPESQRCGKAWIEKRFRSPKYSETTDQPRLTSQMDLVVCRERCPSFDKLCRELEKALSGVEP